MYGNGLNCFTLARPALCGKTEIIINLTICIPGAGR